MLVAIVLAVAVVGSWAQVPIPCAGPTSFSGKFRHMDRERKYFVEGEIYYDEVNKRIREFEFMEIGTEKMAYDKLKLYNLNTEYTVDLKTRKCNVTVPRHSWRPYGVPPFATYRGEGTLGAIGKPYEQVTIAMFEGKFDDGVPFFVSVTEPDCFVVQMGAFSNTTGFDHREFYDVVSGITDPAAFVPPKPVCTCENVLQMPSPHAHPPPPPPPHACCSFTSLSSPASSVLPSCLKVS